MKAKRILFVLLGFVFALAAAIIALLIYIRPDKELTLQYEPFKLRGNLLQGLLAGKPTLVLTEADIRSLLMAQLAANTHPQPNVEILGADLQLDGATAFADLHLRYRDFANVGARLTFELEWQDGTLIVRLADTSVRSIKIPASLFDMPEYKIPINELLPSPIIIRDVSFQGEEVRLTLGLAA